MQPPRPRKPMYIPPTIVQAPLLVKCRCGREIRVERQDVPETHRCPGCSTRFTVVHRIDPDGSESATPKYLDDPQPNVATKPASSTVPKVPADAGRLATKPASSTVPKVSADGAAAGRLATKPASSTLPKTTAEPPKTAAKPREEPSPHAPTDVNLPAGRAPDERLTLAIMLPPLGAIREFIAVLNESKDGRSQDLAAASLIKQGAAAVPFLTANLMAGPFSAHMLTLQCLREINDPSAIGGLAEYARSLRGLGQEDLRAETDELIKKLLAG